MFGFSAIKKVRDEYIERLNGIYGNNLDKVRTTVHYLSYIFDVVVCTLNYFSNLTRFNIAIYSCHYASLLILSN